MTRPQHGFRDTLLFSEILKNYLEDVKAQIWGTLYPLNLPHSKQKFHFSNRHLGVFTVARSAEN
jgi:hypothetical protein